MSDPSNPWQLTPGESAAMDAVCKYGGVKAASRALGLSIRTVEKQLRLAARKMGCWGQDVRKYLMWDRWRRGQA